MYHINTHSNAKEGGETQHQYIQEHYVDNLVELNDADKPGHQYDMMDVLTSVMSHQQTWLPCVPRY